MIHHLPSLYITESPSAGRGVFTTDVIENGSVIEICPVIVLSAGDMAKIHETHLHDYYFIWGEQQDQAAIALGYGSLYNHSDNPNADFTLDYENEQIIIECISDIGEGEEIRIDYHTGLMKRDLWF